MKATADVKLAVRDFDEAQKQDPALKAVRRNAGYTQLAAEYGMVGQ